MKTDILMISSDGSNMEAALEQVDKVAAYKGLSPRNTMHLRLLAEETMAMVRAIAGNVNGEFWMEDEDQMFTLHLRVSSLMDEKKREQLISASTSGKNEATRGFMGKLRSFLQNQPNAKEAWDELEKSVVGHLADDVKVSILGRTVEMTIAKRLD